MGLKDNGVCSAYTGQAENGKMIFTILIIAIIIIKSHL